VEKLAEKWDAADAAAKQKKHHRWMEGRKERAKKTPRAKWRVLKASRAEANRTCYAGGYSQGAQLLDATGCGIFKSNVTCQAMRTNITWLASYPGSGTAWLRAVLQTATGIYSGSAHGNDELFNGGFRGEYFDSPDKVLLVENFEPMARIRGTRHIQPGERALVVIRRPLDAALTWVSTGLMLKKDVNKENVRTNFNERRDQCLRMWVEHADFVMKRLEGQKLITLYENLRANLTLYMEKQILPFLGIDPRNPAVRARLRCAPHLYTPEVDFEYTEDDLLAESAIAGEAIKQVDGYVRSRGLSLPPEQEPGADPDDFVAVR